MKRVSGGTQGYSAGVDDRETANSDDFEAKRPSEPKALASKEIMSTRRIAPAKGAKKPGGSLRPGNFPSAIEQIGNPFSPQPNGVGAVNGINNTTPAFGQSQPAQPSTPYASAGSSITFNSLGQANADSQPKQNNDTSSIGFTFGTAGASGNSSINGTMPSGSFSFGGGASGNNPFTGLSQQSNAQSGSLFSATAKSTANSFPPHQASTVSNFGNSSNNQNQAVTFGGLQPNNSGASFPPFGSSEPQKQQQQQQPQTNQAFNGFGSNAQQQQPTNNIFSGFGSNATQQSPQPQPPSNMFSNLTSTPVQQQGKPAFSFADSTPKQQINNLFTGAATSQSQQAQQSNGIFQQQNGAQFGTTTPQQSNSLFQFTQQKQQPTPQNQSNNIFGQQKSSDQDQNAQETSTANDEESMQVSPPRPSSNQRSLFDTVANGDTSSQQPSSSNVFGYLQQHTKKPPEPSLFSNSTPNQSNPQQNTPNQSGFSFGQSQNSPTTAESTTKPAQPQANIFKFSSGGQTGSKVADGQNKTIEGQSSESLFNSNGGSSQTQTTPSFGLGTQPNSTNSANQNSLTTPDPATPTFQFGKKTNVFGNDDSASQKQAGSSSTYGSSSALFGTQGSTPPIQSNPFPNFEGSSAKITGVTTSSGNLAPNGPSTSSSTSSNIFANNRASNERPAAFANSRQEEQTVSSTADQSRPQATPKFQLGSSSAVNSTGSQSLTPSSGISNKRKVAETAETPSSKALKSNPTLTEAKKNSALIRTTGSKARSLGNKEEPVYETRNAIRALNRSFMKAVAAMDDSKDNTALMNSYLSEVKKLSHGYTRDAKRKLQDASQDESQEEPPETTKRIRSNADPPSTPPPMTPSSQVKSSTANLFQNIINTSSAPARPAAPLFFGAPKTPTRETNSQVSSNEATEDAAATEPPNHNAGKSLFDRISPADKPVTEVKKPVFSFFPPTPTKDTDTPPSDNTWKPDSPIKFGTSQNAPQFLSAGSAPGSTATSRATSPGGDGGTTSEAESTTSNTAGDSEDTEKPVDQFDLTAADPNSEVLFETDKARGMIQNLAAKSWDNKGTGPLRILKDKDSGAITVLLRTIPNGRIVFNSRLNKDLEYKTAGKNAVMLPIVTEGGSLERWHIRCKTQQIADEFAASCESLKA